jgi:hypothetical protein
MSWRRENPDYDALHKLIYEIDELRDLRSKDGWTSGQKVLDGYFCGTWIVEPKLCSLRIRTWNEENTNVCRSKKSVLSGCTYNSMLSL